MTTLAGYFRRVFNIRRSRPATLEYRMIWLFRPYLSTLEDVIMWKNSTVSLCFVMLANFVLWIVNLCDMRPLGLLGCALLVAVVLDTVATALGAARQKSGRQKAAKQMEENAPHLVQTATRLIQWLQTIADNMRQLHADNPSKFCLVSCCGFGSVWLAGTIGGAFLLHVMMTLALVAPLIPSLQQTVASLHHHNDSDGEMEGFLPELSSHALEELQRASDQPPESLSPMSLTADLPLSSDMDVALRYATGEADSSSGEEGEKIISSTSLPSTTDSDSDEEFQLKAATRVTSEKSPKRKQEESGWLASLLKAGIGRPSAPPLDSDSDEFELINKEDL